MNLAMDRPYLFDSRINKTRRFMSKVDNILDAQKDTYAFDVEDEGDIKVFLMEPTKSIWKKLHKEIL